MTPRRCCRCWVELEPGREAAIIYGLADRPACICGACRLQLLTWLAEGVTHQRQGSLEPAAAAARNGSEK
jgi:hypothetical protein